MSIRPAGGWTKTLGACRETAPASCSLMPWTRACAAPNSIWGIGIMAQKMESHLPPSQYSKRLLFWFCSGCYIYITNTEAKDRNSPYLRYCGSPCWYPATKHVMFERDVISFHLLLKSTHSPVRVWDILGDADTLETLPFTSKLLVMIVHPSYHTSKIVGFEGFWLILTLLMPLQ